MAEVATPYPLKWPAGHPRHGAETRRSGKFSRKERKYDTPGGSGWLQSRELTVAEALKRLQAELDRIGARHAVVSSNLETRLDGLPRSGQAEPRDPGVAVYFQLKDRPYCLPCDTYRRVADNIAAVSSHIEATRAIERYGVASISEMFDGFLALPPPKSWRETMGFGAGSRVTLAEVEARYRELARQLHPDSGGSTTAMAELNTAREAARQELT
jgi:hypothetical protein